MIKRVASMAMGFIHNIYECFLNSYKTPVEASLGLHLSVKREQHLK
jgi:hypothetical protein